MRLLLLALLIAEAVFTLGGCTTDSNSSNSSAKPATSTSTGAPAPAYSSERASRMVDAALEKFAEDWQQAVSPERGAQRAWFRNAGRLDAAAWITFVELEPGARPERELVEWVLVRDEAAEQAVDADAAQAARRGGKPLFALKRRVWRLGDDDRATKAVEARLKSGPPIEVLAADSAKVEAGKERPPMSLYSEHTMATALSEWDLEVYDPDQSDPFLGFYFELEESKAFPQASMPLGAGLKAGSLPRKLRATAVIPDSDSAGGSKRMSGEAVRIEK